MLNAQLILFFCIFRKPVHKKKKRKAEEGSELYEQQQQRKADLDDAAKHGTLMFRRTT